MDLDARSPSAHRSPQVPAALGAAAQDTEVLPASHIPVLHCPGSLSASQHQLHFPWDKESPSGTGRQEPEEGKAEAGQVKSRSGRSRERHSRGAAAGLGPFWMLFPGCRCTVLRDHFLPAPQLQGWIYHWAHFTLLCSLQPFFFFFFLLSSAPPLFPKSP